MAAHKTGREKSCIQCNTSFWALACYEKKGQVRFCSQSCYRLYRSNHPEEYRGFRANAKCPEYGCDNPVRANMKRCPEHERGFRFANKKAKPTSVPRRRQTCPNCTKAFVWQPKSRSTKRTYCSVPCARKSQAKRKRKISVSDILKIYKPGMTLSEINAHFGVHKHSDAAANAMKEAGLYKRIKPLTLPPKGRVKELYLSHGLSTLKIAKLYGVSSFWVSKVLHEQNVPMRPKGWAAQYVKIKRVGIVRGKTELDYSLTDRSIGIEDLFNADNPERTSLRISTKQEMEKLANG